MNRFTLILLAVVATPVAAQTTEDRDYLRAKGILEQQEKALGINPDHLTPDEAGAEIRSLQNGTTVESELAKIRATANADAIRAAMARRERADKAKVEELPDLPGPKSVRLIRA